MTVRLKIQDDRQPDPPQVTVATEIHTPLIYQSWAFVTTQNVVCGKDIRKR